MDVDRGSHPGIRTRLHLLAADIVTMRVPPMDDAITLACDLLVAGLDSPATIAVASLTTGDSTFGDSEDLVLQMLMDQGADVAAWGPAGSFPAMRSAFAEGFLSAGELSGPFYEQLPAWDDQDPLNRSLVALFDSWETEADPRRRAAIEDRMRLTIREAGEPT